MNSLEKVVFVAMFVGSLATIISVQLTWMVGMSYRMLWESKSRKA